MCDSHCGYAFTDLVRGVIGLRSGRRLQGRETGQNVN